MGDVGLSAMWSRAQLLTRCTRATRPLRLVFLLGGDASSTMHCSEASLLFVASPCLPGCMAIDIDRCLATCLPLVDRTPCTAAIDVGSISSKVWEPCSTGLSCGWLTSSLSAT